MITKEDAKQLSDEEIIEFINKAKGHTGKDFAETMGTDFSYSFLTSILESRGYRNGWYKASDVLSDERAGEDKVELVELTARQEETVEKTFVINKRIAECWDEICSDDVIAGYMINEALKSMIERSDAGSIKFIISPAKSSWSASKEHV